MAKKKPEPKSKPAKKTTKKKSGKKSDLWTILIIALITVVAGVVLLTRYPHIITKTGHEPVSVTDASLKEVKLFFGDEETEHLKFEKRNIKKGPAETEMKEAIAELLKGPSGKLDKTIPDGTRLLGINIKGNIANIDFSKEIIQNHSGGSYGELQTIYSIINTITLNFPEIKEVQLLIEGKREKTLAGHIDISLPLGQDTKI